MKKKVLAQIFYPLVVGYTLMGGFMGNQSAKTIRLAAIQMASENGKIDVNLKKAEKLVENAADQGA